MSPAPSPQPGTTTSVGAAADASASGGGPDGARPRRPPALSPSRANDFMQCPLLFRFRVIDRLPEPPSPAAARGTLVHAVLDRLFDLPAEDRSVDAAHELVAPQWQRLLETDSRYQDLCGEEFSSDEWLESAQRLLRVYFTLEDPKRLEPRGRELRVETQLAAGPRLRGIIDRIDVAPTGAVRIVDYKTGKSPRPGYEASAAFQMRFYGLVIWRERGIVPAMLQLVYMGDGQILRAEPSARDLELTEQKVRDLWSAMSAAATSGQWTPRRTPLCGWCAHQAVCPLFGGTPPQVDSGAAVAALGLDESSLP